MRALLLINSEGRTCRRPSALLLGFPFCPGAISCHLPHEIECSRNSRNWHKQNERYDLIDRVSYMKSIPHRISGNGQPSESTPTATRSAVGAAARDVHCPFSLMSERTKSRGAAMADSAPTSRGPVSRPQAAITPCPIPQEKVPKTISCIPNVWPPSKGDLTRQAIPARLSDIKSGFG